MLYAFWFTANTLLKIFSRSASQQTDFANGFWTMSNLWGNFMWTGWKNLTFFMSNLFRCNWVVSSLLMKHGRTYNHSSDFKRVKRSVRQQDWQHVVLWCIPGGNKCWFCFTFFSNSWFLFEIEGNYVGVSKNAIFFLTCLSKTIITIFFLFWKI